MNRRTFLKIGLTVGPGTLLGLARESQIMTVLGAIPSSQLGLSLIHEHILVDFIGANRINPDRWDRRKVREAVRPYLQKARAKGVQSFFDCTPAFLGRDVRLLREISLENELHLVTNTGYYGAGNNAYLPPWAFTESAQQLADRWIEEFTSGIDGTACRPGFIKIGVNPGPLSALHQKLVRAAALTHLSTGLTICSHTGPASTALEELQILEELGVDPGAFVWVHAQNETDKSMYSEVAHMGAWVSLDGVGWGPSPDYAGWIERLYTDHQLHKVLVSHDAGWYRPQETDPMEKFKGYTVLFDEVLPELKLRGFSQRDIEQLVVGNPAAAFSIAVRKL